MALIGKPTVKSTTAFSVNSELNDNPYIINFTWNGQRCNGNRLTIIETGRSDDITGLSSTSHKLSKTVCDNLGLVNGNTYHATITMLDYDGNPISNPSDQFLLYCYATPVFKIRDIANNVTIKSTELMVMLDYKSNKMELSSYKFNLRDATGTIVLDSSNELYELPNENTVDYSVCSYTFKGLENNTSYYIEAKGVTVYGMELQCSYYITVETNTSPIYNTISGIATRDGNISLNIKCVPMGYEYNNISYINDEEINLTEKNSYVKYTLIKPLDNFNILTKLRGFKINSDSIISFSDDNNNTISIKPKVEYTHDTIPLNMKNFNWEVGKIPSFTVTNSGTYYIDTTYYSAPDSITLNVKYLDYFYIYCYDQYKNRLTLLYADMGKTYDTSQYAYVRFGFPKKDTYTDYQTKINLTMNYSDETLSTLIRPKHFQYENSTYIDYIKSANVKLNLYVNNQYTINGSSFELMYDSKEDLFYLDENRKFLIQIIRNNGNYKLITTEETEG